MKNSGLLPRRAALELVHAVLNKNRTFDQAMDDSRSFGKLSGADRGLARHLSATQIRRLGEIDALIDHCLDKPLAGRARRARAVLRLGVAQLLFSGVPDHAAVSTAADLAMGPGLAPYRKLINALLRRVGRDGGALRAEMDAARLNTPDWLFDSWAGAYGEDMARRIAEAHLNPAPLDITVRDGDGQAWARKLGAALLPTGSIRLRNAGSIPLLPGYEDGCWWVQDAAAAIPAGLLNPVQGRRCLDLCAAPGGKTLQLAAAGANVTAVDISAGRLKQLSANLARAGLEAAVIAADAKTWEPERPFDAILLDAPCSATGTIRRHPELPHQRTPEDVERLTRLQSALLGRAWDWLRTGGRLVFATCSLQPEEGPDIIDRFLQSTPDAVREPVKPEDVGGQAEFICGRGMLRTLPFHWEDEGGLDGFFAARLLKPA